MTVDVPTASDARIVANLSDHVAVVTGAAQGLGFAIAARLVASGARVILTGDDLAAVQRAAGGIDPDGQLAFPARLDVSSRSDHESVLSEAVARFGKVDILVNNAALTVPTAFFDITDDEWDRVLAVNLRGAFVGMQVFGPHMAELGWGRIVNHASIAGQQGGAVAGAHYAAAKAGMIVLTKVAAGQLAPSGVTVNAIAPAAIEGPAMDSMPAERVATVRAGIPVGRFGTAADVTSAVLYLCSADAGYVTGTTIDINGGLHMR
jgi:3-oxoacyl-[acyl-carrier protein] reductase